MLGEAPLQLRRALSGLATPRPMKSFRLELQNHLCALMEHEDLVELNYCYPGHGTDYLYEPEYTHEHRSQGCAACRENSYCQSAVDASCKDLACSADKLISRKRLEQLEIETNDLGIAAGQTNAADSRMPYSLSPTSPKIWLGDVASGNQVMKNGAMRDDVAEEHNVIAFEMEGAGIWNIFPTIVIKAGCDYADSHKNKLWQTWAAMTAAACAKAFLDQLQMGIPQNVEFESNEDSRQDSSASTPQPAMPQSKHSGVSHSFSGNFYGRNQFIGDTFTTTGDMHFGNR